MVDIEKLKDEIVERLKPLDPDKVILFGSYAYGTPTEDSDIDLYVVTKDEFIPQSFKEKSQVHLKVSRADHIASWHSLKFIDISVRKSHNFFLSYRHLPTL